VPLPRTPEPDEVALYLHTQADGQTGPFSRRGLRSRLGGGDLAGLHLWMEGMSGWEPAEDHREILLRDLDLPAPPADESEDDRNDRLFSQLVKSSWNHLAEQRFAQHIDEVFLGAVITSTLDNGYSLIDLKSDGTHHLLRFEDLKSGARLLFRLTHLTGSLAVAKVLGQRASVVVGYGERVQNVARVFSAIQAEMKSSYLSPEPGTITVDGDLNSGYVYCQVDLLLDIEAYVGRDYAIDHAALSSHVGATTHALRKYLRGRFA
jgi:hypothetical protein